MGKQARAGQRNEMGQAGDSGTHDQYSALGANGAHPYVNASVPNVARIYDYLLGGKDNYSADREAAAELIRLIPDALTACYHNRRFLQRAVRFLAGEAGIRQFIDIGTGLPTQGNVHEVAQSLEPGARVLYVDNDPVVVAHAQALLADNSTVIAINRDLRYPDQILGHPALQALINFDEPVAILLVAVLHFIQAGDGPYEIVEKLKAAMPPGSYLVLSHITADQVPPQVEKQAQRVYDRTNAPVSARSRAEIERFFDGMAIIEPGVVDVCAWRNEWLPPQPGRTIFCAGMASKPSAAIAGRGEPR